MDSQDILAKNINTDAKKEAMQVLAKSPGAALNIAKITKSLCVTCRRKVMHKVVNGRKANFNLLCPACRQVADAEFSKIAEAVK